ncbi:MAG: EAL domain-containing protein [Lachnospiraceae bacterium]|nr:EAL domain-containing protein [Lachnospiraceae bacterium]
MPETSTKKKKGKTIFRTIAVPLLILLLVQVILLSAALYVSGIFRRLRENERSILLKQVQNRQEYLQNVMIGNWMQLSTISESINSSMERLLADGTVTLESMDDSSDACMALLYMIAQDVITDFRAKRVSGIYLIFNADDLTAEREEGLSGRKPGIFIRDLDPAASPSLRNEDLLFEFAPAGLVRSMNISTDSLWSPMFSYDFSENPEDYDFLYKPFQTAYDNGGQGDAQDYGYWSVSPFRYAEDTFTVTYSIPLMLRNGTVYGVIGIDMTPEQLASSLPYPELFDENYGTYILAGSYLDTGTPSTPREIRLKNILTNGEHLTLREGEEITLALSDDGTYYTFDHNGVSYYANIAMFRVYNSNAPFENERLFLAGAVERSRIDSFPNQVLTAIVSILVLIFFLGAVVMMVFSRQISKSIRRLSSEVIAAQREGHALPALSATGIEEIDIFADAISALSQETAESAEREQRIIAHERDYDFLTGLMNRRAFYRSADAVMEDTSSLDVSALIMLDLDNLKQINDRYGHDVGDRYIYRAASCFHDALPDNTLIGRMSGDEFLILMHGYHDRQEIRDIVEALADSIQESVFMLPDHKKDIIRVSGGIAWYPEDGTTFAELMKKADFAMYQAKQDGKGRFAEFDPEKFNRQSVFNRTLAELDDLMQHPELMNYHFQPIVRATDGTIYAYEALMRVSGLPLLRSPDEVLSLARSEHRLHDIEWLTWSRTLACYDELIRQGQLDERPYIFLNSISSEHLTEQEAAEVNDRFGPYLSKLVIEITEGEYMDPDAMEFKRRMPGISGLFALDDYGSGYNSEKMLLDLTPRYIKVDISIIRNIDTSADKQMIVTNIVKYAHEREMFVVAEGLETEAEVRKVLELGVDLLQGYFLSRPARIPDSPSAESVRLIRQYRELSAAAASMAAGTA